MDQDNSVNSNQHEVTAGLDDQHIMSQIDSQFLEHAPTEPRLIIGDRDLERHDAELVDVVEHEVVGDYSYQLEWVFKIDDIGTEISTLTETALGQGSAARHICEVLLRRELKPGEVIRSTRLVGLPCTAVIKLRWCDSRCDDETPDLSIDQILPYEDEIS